MLFQTESSQGEGAALPEESEAKVRSFPGVGRRVERAQLIVPSTSGCSGW